MWISLQIKAWKASNWNLLENTLRGVHTVVHETILARSFVRVRPFQPRTRTKIRVRARVRPQSHNTKYREHVCRSVKRISPPLSSAHRLLQCYHSQWERGDAAISPQPPATIRQLANERAVSSDVTLWRCTFWSGKFATVSSYSIM